MATLKNRAKKRVVCRIWAALFCLLLLALPGCAKEKEHTSTFFAMDTVISIRLAGEEQPSKQTLLAAQQLMLSLEGLWSRTLPDSEISRLNKGDKLTLDARTARLLERAADLFEQTGGAFNPLIAPLTALWDVQNATSPPPTQAIAALLPLPSPACLRGAGGESFSLPVGAQLDLGGIAKGAAGDAVAELLRERGVTSALVVMGGQVGCIGKRPDGEPWRVAIRDPDGQQGETLGELRLSDCFAVSSGDYERYFEYEGARYCHILDPATGWPPQTDLRGVTVVSTDGAAADALSTALFVLGSEGALSLWRERGDFEAVLVTKDGRLLLTKGLEGCFAFTGEERGYALETAA